MTVQMSRFWEAADHTEFTCDEIIDCQGHILAPGFIDIQINGAYGVDFSHPEVTREEISLVSQRLLRHGVTSYLPTIVSSSARTYFKTIPKVS